MFDLGAMIKEGRFSPKSHMGKQCSEKFGKHVGAGGIDRIKGVPREWNLGWGEQNGGQTSRPADTEGWDVS